MTGIVKLNRDLFDLPSVLDIAFPRKIFRDEPDWNSFYTTDVFPYDVKAVKDKDGNLIKTELVFAVAGVDKNEICVKVEKDDLCINIEQSRKSEEKGVEYIRKGLSHRSMSKIFKLQDVDVDNIKSKLENGILTITLPPTPAARKRNIVIDIE